MFTDQSEYEIRCEWGLAGVTRLAPLSDAVVIVDVLSFTTCVDIAVSSGAWVYPYNKAAQEAASFALAREALLAGPPGAPGYSLSASSLVGIPAGTRLVLPSPNGSTLSLAGGATPTLAGCLRNAQAVARAAARLGRRISVIPAGERWPDGSLRPAVEDLAGAGAVIAGLPGSRSPEAEIALAAFRHARTDLLAFLRRCSSGVELLERGRPRDVELAAALDASACAPVLFDGVYQDDREDSN